MKRGFTLVEIMTVVAIIGIVVSIAVPNVIRVINNAKRKQAVQDLDILSNAIMQLAMDTGKWPTTAGGYGEGKLSLTIAAPLDGAGGWDTEVEDIDQEYAGLQDGTYFGTRWDGPYIEDIHEDPWGTDYWFDPDYRVKHGSGYQNVAVIGSYGPNKVGKNNYDDDDIFIIVGRSTDGGKPGGVASGLLGGQSIGGVESY